MRPLRVGVVLDSTVRPRWIEHALGLVANGQTARITMVITCLPPTGAASGAGPNRSHALYRRFIQADRQVFRRQPDPFERVDIIPMVGNAANLRVGHGTPLTSDVVSALDDADLDVILCFGSPTVARHLVGYARHGAWFYPDFLTVDGTDRPVGFEATVAGRDMVTTSLNELTPEGTPGRTLYTAVSAVNRYSPHYTDRRVKWTMATFPTGIDRLWLGRSRARQPRLRWTLPTESHWDQRQGRQSRQGMDQMWQEIAAGKRPCLCAVTFKEQRHDRRSEAPMAGGQVTGD